MDATSSPAHHGGHATESSPSGFDVPETPGIDGIWTSGVHLPRWVANTGLIALALLVASGMFVHAARGILFTPDAAATAFFTALAERDTAPANGIRTDLITDDTYQPPADPTVETVHPITPDLALVVVGFDLAGTRWRTELTAARTHFWGPWTITPPSSRVTITWPPHTTGLLATVNGTALQAGERLLPGVYTVGTAEHDTFTAAGEVPLVVSGTAESVTVAPPITPRTDLAPRLSTLVDTYLDDCAAGAGDEATVVPGCPLRLEAGLPWPEHISWRIDAYPELALTIGELKALEVTTLTPGRATATFEQDGEAKTHSIALSPGGWVELTAGRMVWHRDNLAYVSE
ncbi:hypothetical protein [Phytomonospora endophytica]|uniref:Uncharacterized protein n=1 Tax=Phytomonospora endophytica TaxID=714109 RepID=A0A841FXT3_9ACTN|nr:hypothetical protein [Phytomonospora endophytica]MBB6038528.1 hypothetical protein [Phytomonospora endophytica]GIG69332.1 hypothetical protein Pen01_56270 [Phytomonospora endophytica]